MEFFIGLTIEITMEVGKMENKMVLVFIHWQVEKLDMEDGKKVKELNGLLKLNIMMKNDQVYIRIKKDT